MPEIYIYIGVILVSSYVIWKGSNLLESSAEKISLYYNLPPAVHGGIVVAVGSSFPELSGTVLSTALHGDFELGLSTVIGSAIFNILVIPALAGLLSRKTIKIDKGVIYKDVLFYIIAVAILMITFSFAVIYYPVDRSPLTGNMTRLMALLPVGIYALYLFIQQQEIQDNQNDTVPQMSPGKQWVLLIVSLLLVLVGVEGLVRSCIFLGHYFNTASFIWGITVIAVVTSFPDMIVSIQMSKKGQGIPSITNVLGSNIFDLLIAVPVGVLIAGSTEVNYLVATPLMGVLMLFTIVLFAFLRIKLSLSKTDNWSLLICYFLFILWIVLEGADWVNVINI